MNDQQLTLPRIAPMANPGDGHGQAPNLDDAPLGRPPDAERAIDRLIEAARDSVGQAIAESRELSRGGTQRAGRAEIGLAVLFLRHGVPPPWQERRCWRGLSFAYSKLPRNWHAAVGTWQSQIQCERTAAHASLLTTGAQPVCGPINERACSHSAGPRGVRNLSTPITACIAGLTIAPTCPVRNLDCMQ